MSSAVLQQVVLTVGTNAGELSWLLPSFTYTASKVGTFSFNAQYAGNDDWFPGTSNCVSLIEL
jgi:hypothetical protein